MQFINEKGAYTDYMYKENMYERSSKFILNI